MKIKKRYPEKDKEYRERNKENIKNKQKEYYQKNKECIKKRNTTNNCKGCDVKINRKSIRCKSCSSIGGLNSMYGKTFDDAPTWKGGISFGEYGLGFNKRIKQKVRERDNHKCFNCNNCKRLIVHHKDFNKKNNELGNLITVCQPCHNKIHMVQWGRDKNGRFAKAITR